MSLFRSEDMNLCKLIVTKDNAFEVIEALGMIDEVFIVNLNPDEQPQKLTYSREVSKWNEIVSKIDFIMSEWVKYSVNINKVKTFKEFVQMKEFLQKSLKLSKLTILDYLNKEIKSKNDFLKEQTERIENMCQDYDDLIEYHKVIEATHKMLEWDQFKGMRSRLDSMSEIDFSGTELKNTIVLNKLA